MPRTLITSRAYAVPVAGFTHAVLSPPGGRFVFVSGVTSRGRDGGIVGIGDLAAQTRQVYENLSFILGEAGASLDDLVRLVTYLRDMEQYPQMQEVRRAYLRAGAPASTTVEVSRLFHPDLLIEVEATALVESGRP
jgi:enamine deaminase RidA (YjgF/YER057c/UK114 family)